MSARMMYMHTMDGRPAEYYEDGHGAWLAFVAQHKRGRRGGGRRRPAPLVASSALIKAQQTRALANMAAYGRDEWTLGYITVEVPE